MVIIVVGFIAVNLIWSLLFIVLLSVKENKSLPKILNPFAQKVEKSDEDLAEASNEDILKVWQKNFNNNKVKGDEEIE